ncbi:N-acetylglucosamine-6-phosphate deacetylase [Alkalibacillus haloalkaliphilus]|uniref:N-acetylglucosamine-6-phosphate deacetylase n=1 Tax=Alkalibacillus haloalkaliphilus TaxID=94136 RepID=A0A511WBB8_9BACI|nr:N-acetylglucosamine-6-phosphate deacetylase [Alkalibacillus haloalkaliphilus]GEN46602.1 N-acetylglucosamine-6-phosphate deacetylase [Alkalibacillus haloalkaliphilus]
MFSINHVNLYLEDEVIVDGAITVEDGRIVAIHHKPLKGGEIVDGKGLNLVPGFIDTHIHGASGFDVMDGTEQALEKIAEALPKEGTTAFLATTLTSPLDELDQVVNTIAQYSSKQGQAEVLGAHVEGPFIEKSKAGAQPPECIIEPDLDVAKRWADTGTVKAMTLAPELDGASQLIRYLDERGVIASAGHTDASFQDIEQACREGLRQLTHLCNAMNGVHHREVGAVGAAMLMDELKSELIVDGIHVSDDMVKILYKTLGPDKILMITDAMRAKGLSDGTYTLGSHTVTVEGQSATLTDGTLAGSVLTMDEAVRRMLELCEASFHDVIKMTAENPAKQYGVWDLKGSIAVGKDADFLLVDDQFNIHSTYCKGVISYEAHKS